MSRRDFVLKLSGRNGAGVTTTYNYDTTGHYDTVGTAWEDGRLKVAGVIRRDLFGAGRLRGAMDVNDAVAVLENTDGELDFLRDICFDLLSALLFEFDSAGNNVGSSTLLSEQPIVDEREVTVALHDRRHGLDRLLTSVRYAGTNSGSPLAGIEGTADDLAKTPKPILLGKVFNVTPILVNTTKRIYQLAGVNAGSDPGGAAAGFLGTWSAGRLTVYDKRSALTAGSVYTSQSDMETTAPSAGQYRVWPAGGCFRLGSAPTGRVTCDVLNDSATVSVSAVASKLMRITQPGIVGTPVSHLTASPDCGIYITSEVSGLEALSQVLGSVNASVLWGQGPGAMTVESEVARFVQLTLPADSPYAATLNFEPLELTETDIVEDSVKQLVPGDASRGLPVWRVKLGYQRNWTVMSDADLSGVAAADAAFCKAEYRYVTAEDSSVKTQWPNAGEMNVDTLLVNLADAQDEADRLLAMFSTRRDVLQLTVPIDVLSRQITNHRKIHPGWVVNITHPRFGLGSGKDFILIGMQDNLDAGQVELTVWG